MIRTEGRWNPKEESIYFVATSGTHIKIAKKSSKNVLIAINEIKENNLDAIHDQADSGSNVFIDSGVFNLTNEHMRKTGITMDEALALPPDEIEGFDKLFDSYIDIITQLRSKVWGYIEIDQGGRDNKIKTREKLESLGFRPIPVYHPLNDGWEYFDYLAERYDRICFGNIVQADRDLRKKLIATAHERRKKYPDLWIHILGMTPNELNVAYPITSCDSSSAFAPIRWGPTFFKAGAMLKTFDHLKRNFMWNELGTEINIDEYNKCVNLVMQNAHFDMMNWRTIQRDYEEQFGVTR